MVCLSALIVRASRDIDLVSYKKAILSDISMQRKNLHMKDIKNYEHKCYVARKVGEFPARYVSVLSNKDNIDKNDFIARPNMYYWYLSRLLIQRISWCCSNLRANVPEGNGKVKIVFSNRGGLQYSDFKQYLREYKQQNVDDIDRINWNVIDIDDISSKDHFSIAGLQFADVIAYSHFKAVEESRLAKITDINLIKNLKHNIYKHNGIINGYGIKIMPKYEDIKNKPTELWDMIKR